MKLFGSLKELVNLVFRKDTFEITVKPNQTITYMAARSVELPEIDTDEELVGKAATQTLTNKTLTSPTINSPGINSGFPLTATSNELEQLAGNTVGGNSAGDILTTNGTQDVTNKTVTVTDNLLTVQDNGDSTKKFNFDAGLITTATTRTLQVPNADDVLVGKTIAQALSNKTLNNTNSISVLDSALTIEGTTANANFDADSLTVGRTFTLPDADGTIVLSTDKADKDLGNLTATAINQNLLPDADNTRNLGSASKAWNSAFVNDALTGESTVGFDFKNNAATGITDINLQAGINFAAAGSINIKNGTLRLNEGGSTLGLNIESDSAIATTNKTLTIDVNNADKRLDFGGDLTTSTGNITLTADAGGSSVTLPVSGTMQKNDLSNIATSSLSAFTSIGTPDSGDLLLIEDITDGSFKKVLAGNLGGSGSGQGGINYVENPDAETDTTGWADSGGTLTIARTTTGAEVLRGTGSFKITAASAAASDHVKYAFTIDNADKNRLMRISFEKSDISGYVAGDLAVVIRDVTGAVDITPSLTLLPGGSAVFEALFVTNSNTSYELRFVEQVGSNTYTISVDNIKVTPELTVQGNPMTEWQAFTPNWAGFTPNGTEYWAYSRDGTDMLIQGYSTGAVTSTLSLTVPLGLTIDTSSRPADVAWNVGTVTAIDTSLANWHVGNVSVQDSTTLRPRPREGATSVFNGTKPFTWVSTDQIGFEIRIPIAEWAGSVTFGANSRVEYAYNTNANGSAGATYATPTAYGPQGTPIIAVASTTPSALTYYTVEFQQAIQPTDKIGVEIQDPTSGVWIDSEAWDFRGHRASTAFYGVWINPTTSAKKINVAFGNMGMRPDSTYGAASAAAWSVLTAYKWRAYKSSNPLGIGTGLATATQPGAVLLPNSSVVADTPTGHGSSGTKIRTFTSGNTTTVGTAITYASNTTTGDTFTINEDGVYFINYSDTRSTAVSNFGISVNASTTTNIYSLAQANLLAYVENPAAIIGHCATTARLSAGDVIRAHDNGANNGAAVYTQFRIVKVSS